MRFLVRKYREKARRRALKFLCGECCPPIWELFQDLPDFKLQIQNVQEGRQELDRQVGELSFRIMSLKHRLDELEHKVESLLKE